MSLQPSDTHCPEQYHPECLCTAPIQIRPLYSLLRNTGGTREAIHLSQHKTPHWLLHCTRNRCGYAAAATQHRCHIADERFVPIAPNGCINSVVQRSFLLRVGGCRRWGSLFHRRCRGNSGFCPLSLPATQRPETCLAHGGPPPALGTELQPYPALLSSSPSDRQRFGKRSPLFSIVSSGRLKALRADVPLLHAHLTMIEEAVLQQAH